MKKKNEEQLCLFNPSYEEVLSWDGMNSISHHRLKTLMDKFFIKETKRRKGKNK